MAVVFLMLLLHLTQEATNLLKNVLATIWSPQHDLNNFLRLGSATKSLNGGLFGCVKTKGSRLKA